MTDRYQTLQDRVAELEKNRTATDDAFQELVERSTQEKYESLQSKLIELENNITTRDDSLQEIEASVKELERSIKERDEANEGKLIEIEKRAMKKDTILQEMMLNITRSAEKVTEIEKNLHAKENALQEVMRNMTRLEDKSKVRYEELEVNLNKLQNESKNSFDLQTAFIKNYNILRPCKETPTNASKIINLGNRQSVIVHCDQAPFGKGWIIFQYRYNGKVDFYRTWAEYRDGFGTLDGEFWLGLKYLHQLTTARKHELMVEVKDYNGNYGYAKYDHFEVGSEAQKFVLKLGSYSGTAGDSMTYNIGMKFTTKDSDNDDSSSTQCAEDRNGAWWHQSCTYANLNGPYGNLSGNKAMYWYYLKKDYRAIVYTRMMLREIN
ncbi:hypothetical protein ZHAS_00018386 [Anopheles sinensis]|uniref:Fibrinogen C-terminal domain-containing protein n=1 Tax=Anopheles sinensis TaxID=74873 RepID=A0A084WHN8_ANOSI|nr:hypothetical protein ZHAS_00018386 [Anopheles sinensis]